MSTTATFETLLVAVRGIATEVAAVHAADVDASARFPSETFDALRAARVLSAPVPRELGGSGCSMMELALLCSTLSQACSASGMVLAMHYIEVACLARHGMGSAFFRGYMQAISDKQLLIASVTSEVGTFGDTRSSICAVEVQGDRFTLRKDATTVSYGAHADSLLVTARRAPDASNSDQVLVLLQAGDYTLTPTSNWDTLGMRGTCSPGGRLEANAGVEQILPGEFAESSAQTMVPYSHILWSSLWWGIAADAVSRAGAFVRGQARKNPGTVPPAAHQLAEATAQLQVMRAAWAQAAAEFDQTAVRPEGMQELLSMAWALKLINLKVSASEAAPRLVHMALQIIGVMGYKNDSPFSVGRHYRDALSASLMISNERLMAKSASMLLVLKDA
ncbi:acyl-CoA dehydrogenase family protein [Piscinibacter terrae]|uniref:Acyl-CoA dehydrogenase n=1 Tax=Piscinibacter terrae TaxID=2496871 RepID=A0A3N7HWE0_9BURK|nr:acyl-CoA dehydrogenase family protein [Albitalea terrae]RQP26173.1 acyl-CoA dehydrogenase [Albitalea terrae]